jgi:GNAT superfamily N-acetyltransferase
MFKKYHYLGHTHNNAARVFLGVVNDQLFGFCSVLYFPHSKVKNHWREHRTVVFPDFQGIGLGHQLSNSVGDLLKSEGKTFISTSSNPAFINSRSKDPKWIVTRKGRTAKIGKTSTLGKGLKSSNNRISVSFKYIG